MAVRAGSINEASIGHLYRGSGSVLGVDIGQKCGWAIVAGGVLVDSGAWKLDKEWVARFNELAGNLESLWAATRYPFSTVAYEDVKAHGGVKAAHAYGAGLYVVRAFAREHLCDDRPVQISDVKRTATGKGGGAGTGKAEVLAAARAMWPDHDIATEDEADAIFIAMAASRSES